MATLVGEPSQSPYLLYVVHRFTMHTFQVNSTTEILYTWYYWRVEYLAVCSKNALARFLIGGFEYSVERNPCLQPKWCTFNLAMFM